jgi:peptidoglycan/xylan/chitin deacetylase (PgdA/CDA1 family)
MVGGMQILRTALRKLRAEAHRRSGAARRARARLDGSCAAVLCYHRVLPAADAARAGVEPGMFVTPDTFRRHLEWFTRELRVLPLGEVVARLLRGEPLPPRACALTFDDGWRDGHQHAWPALREAGLPATIFLVTGRVGTPGAFWPDEVWRRLAALPPAERRARVRELLGAEPAGAPEHAAVEGLKRLAEPERARALDRLRAATPAPRAGERELLDWSEVEEMARGGQLEFESHGATHAILCGLAPERMAGELRDARAALRDRGLGRHALLAYPSGAFDPQVVEAARACGHRAAFTTRPGLAALSAPPLTLPRILLHEDVSASTAELGYRVPGRAS